jgi:ATP-dependent helicase/nuclease subunit A
MKTRRPLPPGELQARIDATDPQRDAWVSAHAGSGKTRILRNRVIRLLLDGTPPDRILCHLYPRCRRRNAEPHLRGAGTLGDAGG